MKRVIMFMLIMAMLLSLAACGSSNDRNGSDESETEATVNENPGETTLSPREQFEKTKEAMDELNKKKDETDTAASAVSYTTNGITYTLDSSFTAGNEAADNFQHKYTSDSMWITVQIESNTFGYGSSRELAEYIAAQKDGREVGSANGVYYVEDAASGTVKAYYVNNSGNYWIIYGFVTSGNDYNACRSQLIEFCTSGKIN